MNATNNQHNYFNKNDRTHVSRRSCYVFFHINVPLLQLKTQCNDRVWDFLNKSPARLCSPVPDTQVRSSWKWIQIEPETPTFHTSALFRQNFKCLAKSEFSFVCWASQQRKLGGQAAPNRDLEKAATTSGGSGVVAKPLLSPVSRQKPGPQGWWSQGHNVITPTPDDPTPTQTWAKARWKGGIYAYYLLPERQAPTFIGACLFVCLVG